MMGVERLESKHLARVEWPVSHAVRAGDWVFVSGMLPLDKSASVVGATPGRADVAAQTAQCLDNLDHALSAFGIDRSHVAKTKTYFADLRHRARSDAVLQKSWPRPGPARSYIGSVMPIPDAALQVEAIAHLTQKPQEVVPAKPVGLGSLQAAGGTKVGNFHFSNGHRSTDATGKLIARGDIRGQVEQSLDDLGECLKAAGMDYSDVLAVHATVPYWYGFNRYNEVYSKYFREPFPARASIQGRIVTESALVEFEAFSAKGKKKVTVESVVTGVGHYSLKKRDDTVYVPELPGSMAPHCHAVQVDDTVYICGEIAYEGGGLMVGTRHAGDIGAQTIMCMGYHGHVMQALGGTIDDIVKTNISITEGSMIPGFLEEYAKFFKAPYPAMTIDVVTGLAQDGVQIEIEAIAVIGAAKDRTCLV
jgi:enamine deaminase RidA (YjgF/YER057c/UK114 family)